jgi:hypothetical protein
MRPQEVRLERWDGRWHVTVRRAAESATDAVWVSLGGCRAQLPALRLWLALLTQGDRR